MRYLFALLLFSSCLLDDTHKRVVLPSNDTPAAAQYSRLSDRIFELQGQLKNEPKYAYLLAQIDSLQQDVLHYQNSAMQLAIVEKRLD